MQFSSVLCLCIHAFNTKVRNRKMRGGVFRFFSVVQKVALRHYIDPS